LFVQFSRPRPFGFCRKGAGVALGLAGYRKIRQRRCSLVILKTSPQKRIIGEDIETKACPAI
jgi:hypothetical protein